MMEKELGNDSQLWECHSGNTFVNKEGYALKLDYESDSSSSSSNAQNILQVHGDQQRHIEDQSGRNSATPPHDVGNNNHPVRTGRGQSGKGCLKKNKKKLLNDKSRIELTKADAHAISHGMELVLDILEAKEGEEQERE